MQTSPTLTGPEVSQDIDLIARRLPGRGQALARMFERADVTQESIASQIGVNRSAISNWLREIRWPKPPITLKLLIALNVDRKIVAEASSIMMGGEVAGDVFRKIGSLNTLDVTKEGMLELLKNSDDFTQRDLIFRGLGNHVLLALGLKAAGVKGGEACNEKAAKIFMDEWRIHEEEARRRGIGDGHPPSSAVSDWAAGRNITKTGEPQAAEIATKAAEDGQFSLHTEP